MGRWSPPGFSFMQEMIWGSPPLSNLSRLLACAGKRPSCKHRVLKIQFGHESRWLITDGHGRFCEEPRQYRGGQEREEGNLRKDERVSCHYSMAAYQPPPALQWASVCVCLQSALSLDHLLPLKYLITSCVHSADMLAALASGQSVCGGVCLCGSVWVFWLPMLWECSH